MESVPGANLLNDLGFTDALVSASDGIPVAGSAYYAGYQLAALTIGARLAVADA